ncbi:hypothetical protein [Fulvimarina sp. MAC3]|uniref:hypothetical protein n=1 Tax=Fulvimarina sp. MAC3 TaxID=3148887 RepID=UPI0031FCC0B9
MWFNHKTVIFGGFNATAQKKANASNRARETRDLDKNQLADIGMDANAAESRLTAAMSKLIHETRFTGYRGEVVA